ncbi:MAG: hypothetical protein R3229_01120 [Alphaproteobacteria bacterium]|nr:hypothetical protein [Alphaproteobacteria bacterium]
MSSVSFIPIDVSKQMRSREKPLWIAKPIPRAYALKEGAQTFVNGVLLIALVVYLEYGALESGDMAMVAIGIPFALLGLYFMSAPVREYIRARRTTYVITNQRLIILNGLFRSTVDSFAPFDIGSLEVDIADDGSGSIIFQEKRDWRAHGGRFLKKVGFKAVERALEAQALILTLKGQARGPDGSKEPSGGEVERYRGYEIKRIGDGYRVGDDTFVDAESAKAHIDANWARSRQ